MVIVRTLFNSVHQIHTLLPAHIVCPVDHVYIIQQEPNKLFGWFYIMLQVLNLLQGLERGHFKEVLHPSTLQLIKAMLNNCLNPTKK